MTSYPAKPYVVPYDDWFNNNSINFKKSITNQTKTIYTVHEFFYRQSNVKVGGSDNFLGKNLEKKSSKRSLFHLFEILINVSYLQAKKNIFITRFLENLNQ